MSTTNENVVGKLYDQLNIVISDLIMEKEGKGYDACSFIIDRKKIVYRKANITPKKKGQFVTFWKRNSEQITTPFSENDPIDFYVITVETPTRLGQFIFPKALLIKKGLMSTSSKDGKRGFRVYPPWDTAQNNQAKRTQSGQLDYFVPLDSTLNNARMIDLLNA